MENNLIKLDFAKDFEFDSKNNYLVYLNGEQIVLTKFKQYDGPITLQYLPNGGIQSLFDYNLIVKVNNGFLGVKELFYKGNIYTSKAFIEMMGDDKLINQILE